MVERVNFKVHGAAEIERAMKELGQQAANRIARSALNRGGTPIVKRAKDLVPVNTGELKKAISKRLRRQRRGSDKQTLVIGIENPTSRRAHFTEFGTANSAASPFLRPAMDETQATVVQTMTDAMRVGIEREIKKLHVRPKVT